jgi:ATP-dependent Clp protease ATP-binding subunit ClpC
VSHHLVGVAEIAELLGVSRQRVDQIASSYPDFPAPEAELAAGRIWARAAVREWMAVHPERRPGREEGRPIAFERFTDRARRAFARAQDEARALVHAYLGCEHLVVGLAAEEASPAAQALSDLGIGPDTARAALRRLVPGGRGPAPDTPLPFTPRLRRALEEAERASIEFRHRELGAEHLLLGVLREGENVGCRLILECGVSPDELTLKLLEVMGFPQPRGPDPVAGLAPAIEDLSRRIQRIEKSLGL